MFWTILWLSTGFYIHGFATHFDIIGVDVDSFLKERQPELEKLCENELNEYTWKSPKGKLFYFKASIGNLSETKIWTLISVNHIPVWVMDRNPAMDFRIISSLHKISLVHLYPTYPKFSGVDVFQFLMSVAYTCQFSISLFDGSHISEPYRLIFGQGYYEQLIHGPSYEFHITTPIKKDDFLKCVHLEVNFLGIENGEIYKTILKNLDTCYYFGDDNYIKNCPIHYPWLSPRLYTNIFSTCAISADDWFPPSEIDPNDNFQIRLKDLHRILNKKYPPKSLTYEELVVEKIPILKTKEKIITELKHGSVSKILDEAFSFCTIRLGKEEFSPFEIFKNIMQECVPETTNFLFKYDCDSFKVISE